MQHRTGSHGFPRTPPHTISCRRSSTHNTSPLACTPNNVSTIKTQLQLVALRRRRRRRWCDWREVGGWWWGVGNKKKPTTNNEQRTTNNGSPVRQLSKQMSIKTPKLQHSDKVRRASRALSLLHADRMILKHWTGRDGTSDGLGLACVTVLACTPRQKRMRDA